MRSARRLTLAVVLACAAAAALATSLAGGAPTASRDLDARAWKIHYRAHNGVKRVAWVLLPSWYSPDNNPRIPLIISPHGRGVTARGNMRLWGDLPTRGVFGVVNPAGHGRKLAAYSWGYKGQVDDLARMPEIVRRALPWVRIDSSHVYAFGGSMGGQETLLLLAHYPKLLAGAAVFDSVSDFAAQYRAFPRLGCNNACKRQLNGRLGHYLQKLARTEVGGSPSTAPFAYARRSPITYARRIAMSCVPLQVWWSHADRIVVNQAQQSGKLVKRIRSFNPYAPVHSFTGLWIHSVDMRARTYLPLALATFDLLPREFADRSTALHVEPPTTAC